MKNLVRHKSNKNKNKKRRKKRGKKKPKLGLGFRGNEEGFGTSEIKLALLDGIEEVRALPYEIGGESHHRRRRSKTKNSPRVVTASSHNTTQSLHFVF